MNAGRLRLLFAVALVLLAMVDFTRRVHVPRDVQARDAASFVPADVAPSVTAAIVSKDLATWLPGLTPVAEGAGTGCEPCATLPVGLVGRRPADLPLQLRS